MKTKFIFDLDGTLIKSNYDIEREYFYNIFGNDEFNNSIGKILYMYETTYKKYDIDTLCNHFNKYSEYKITKSIIIEWINMISNMDNPIMEDSKELLEELKEKKKNIILLTNWFTDCQVNRLKTGGLYKYFDELYGGDKYLKPNKEAYLNAIGDTPIEECIMIGDNYNLDIVGAENIGLDAIYFNKNDKIEHKNKIKELKEIRKWI